MYKPKYNRVITERIAEVKAARKVKTSELKSENVVIYVDFKTKTWTK